MGYVVCFDFFGAAAVDAGRFVLDQGVAKDAARDPWPLELIHHKGGCRADVGLGFKTESKDFCELAKRAHHGGIEVLAAHAETSAALNAFVAVDGGAVDLRIDVNRAHRADRNTVRARYAFVGIDQQRPASSTTSGFSLS